MKKLNWKLGLILILAAIVRFWDLFSLPLGLNYDEASISYEAYSIKTWRRDSEAKFLPLTFKSYGDYKPPLMIYVTAIFDLIYFYPYMPRVVSAVAGTLLVLVIYLLIKVKINQEEPALVGALIAATSGWLIHLSRVGFEQMLTTTLVALGILGLETYLISRHKRFLLGIFSLILAMYSFHTAVVVVPIYFIWWLWRVDNWQQRALAILMASLLLVPFGFNVISNHALTRASTLINNPKNLLINTFAYLNPWFWFGGQDGSSVRNAIPSVPLIPISAMLLIVLGINNRWGLMLTLIGLLPGLISTPAPHIIRTQIMVIGLIILAANGYSRLKTAKKWLVSLGLMIELGWLGYQYIVNYRVVSATSFQYGYQEAFNVIKQEMITGENIYITDNYEKPYIYWLLFNQTHPQQYLFGELNKFKFEPIKWSGQDKPGLYLGTVTEIPANDPRVIKTITVPKSDIVVLVVARIENK